MGLAVVPFRFFNPVLAAKIKKNVGTALFGIPFFFPEMHHQHFFLERRAYLAVLVGILHAGGQRRGRRKLHTPSGIAQIRSVKRLLGML